MLLQKKPHKLLTSHNNAMKCIHEGNIMQTGKTLSTIFSVSGLSRSQLTFS